jgi:Uma2 family endonuclease
VVEVVSTNWRDDYGLKLADYEAMGIVEYWIVDFRALGAAASSANPNSPPSPSAPRATTATSSSDSPQKCP